MDKTTQILKAIADETRMKILNLLLRHNYCVRALAKELMLSEATISQHLKILREADLLVGKKHGYFMHYDVKRSVLLEIAGKIELLATIEREECHLDNQDNCHGSSDPKCHKQKECGSEVQEFCHGTKRGGVDEKN